MTLNSLGRVSAIALALVAASSTVGACGGTDRPDASAATEPSVVVTHSILGDIVSNLVGPSVEITVLIPRGVDPHAASVSARDAAAIRSVGAVVANGGGFDAPIADALDGAREDGVDVFEMAESLPPDARDPHFFTDPVTVAQAIPALAAYLSEHVVGLDADDIDRRAKEYRSDLEALAVSVERALSAVPESRRVLITNHDVFGPFAERFDLNVVATVVPGRSTSAEASAAQLSALEAAIRDRGVPAIFVDFSSRADLAQRIANDTGVEVVELFTETLDEPGQPAGTYVGMIAENAERIAAALR